MVSVPDYVSLRQLILGNIGVRFFRIFKTTRVVFLGKWGAVNCCGNLTNCGWVTGDRLASRSGGVEILLAASCYRNCDKLRQLWASHGSKALHTHNKRSGLYLVRKHTWILVLWHLFLAVFLKLCSWKTVRFSQKTMFADESLSQHIFQMKVIVFIIREMHRERNIWL